MVFAGKPAQKGKSVNKENARRVIVPLKRPIFVAPHALIPKAIPDTAVVAGALVRLEKSAPTVLAQGDVLTTNHSAAMEAA